VLADIKTIVRKHETLLHRSDFIGEFRLLSADRRYDHWSGHSNCRLPREYLGQAQVLLIRVHADGLKFKVAIDRIYLPRRQRYQTHGKVGRELLAGALHEWQRAPAFGRLGDLHHELKDYSLNLKGYSLNIGEFRLLSADTRYDHRAGSGMEPSLVTELVTLTIDKKQCHKHCETLVAISLHALARRLERYPLRDVDDILADIKVIVRKHEILLRQSNFIVPCQSGRWLGEVVKANFQHCEPPRRVLAIRTFVDARIAASEQIDRPYLSYPQTIR
jgi:hypothetical protein